MMGISLMLKNRIVLVSFPFDDLRSTKVRPALCLTNTISSYNHVVVAFITSKAPENILDSDVLINSDDFEFDTTGLKVSSTIRLHRIITVSTSIIRRNLGVLPVPAQKLINGKLKKLFNI